MKKIFSLFHSRFVLSSLVALTALALWAPGVAKADAIVDGTMNFTVTSETPSTLAAPTGSFVFDATTNIFSSFTVNWDGVVYSAGGFVLSSINSSNVGNPGTWCAASGVTFSGCLPLTAQVDLDGISAVFLMNASTSYINNSAGASGTYTVTETSPTPASEPSSMSFLVLGLTGLLAFGVARRQAIQSWVA